MAKEGNKGDRRNKTIAEEAAKIVAVSAMLLFGAVAMTSLISEAISQERKGLNCVTRWVNGRSYEFCGPSPHRSFQPAPNRTWGRRSGDRLEWHAPPAPPRIGQERPERQAPSANPSFGPGERVELPRDGGRSRPVVQPGERSQSPNAGIVPGAAPRPMLQTVRSLIEPSELPPPGVAAYGIVAFSSMAVSTDIERYKFVCEAFKATLVPQESLPAGTPLSVQMITFWPIRNKHTAAAIRADCSHLIENYDLEAGLNAIRDADKQAEKLTERRGPFLVAWSPAESRYQSDSLVLVMDLSRLDGQDNFLEIFQTWRRKIVDNPALWKGGFVDIESFRRTVRDTLDRYGEGILKLIKAD
jgi:hypothetical protein